MSDWLDNLRYDHPGIYRALLAALGVFVFALCFMLLPDSPILRAMGITGLQKRVSAAANGVYWSTRAMFHNNIEVEHTQLYGNVDGIDQSGKIIITVPQGDKWVRLSFALANIEIADIYGVAQIAGSLRTESARFELYGNEYVVVWIRNTPLNVKLIEAGVANPAPRPPTNIFDLAFAAYYWGIAKGQNGQNGQNP
jgi:hypothetical protein